jgi:primosomal protein N' (replication factor Y)
VFAPLENLGIIIIDEEHDGSYQSESNPRYFTHDIAIMRSAKNHCPVVLGSATPSVETYFNTRPASTSSGCNDNIKTKYRLLEMKNRVNGVAMPGIEIVDMVHEIRSGNGGIFARSFLQSLFETLKKGRSAMIFLNRRGYSQSVRCMQCGWVAKCQNCDISLVYHRDEEQLKCHYCDARFTIMAQCPNCGGKYLRYGVIGTQKVAAELERLLADGGLAVPVLRMDADNTKTKDSLIDILNKFASAAPSVLVGTQMIAKGHHFPDVDFVGVVDADASLHVGDYRSAERTFSLLTQVAGRAGRETGSRSSVFIQTYMPKHYVYKFVQSYDYKGFYEKEINTRAATKYPPFSVIARVLVSGGAEIKIKSVLEAIMKKLRGHPGVVSRPDPFLYLGAMKCPHGRLQNKFRYQVLARISRQDAAFVIDCIDDAVKSVQPDARGIQIFLEINPGNLT